MKTLKIHAKGDSWRRAVCGAFTDNVGEPVTCGACLRVQEARSNPTRRRTGHEMRDNGQAYCGVWPDSFDYPVTCETCLRAIEALR